MTNNECDKVELPALKQLQKLGWHYIAGAEFLPVANGERESFRGVVLEKYLRAAILRINPWISDENLRKVMRDITHPAAATLMEANQNLWHIWYNQLMVSTHRDKAAVGTISSKVEHYLEWKDPYPRRLGTPLKFAAICNCVIISWCLLPAAPSLTNSSTHNLNVLKEKPFMRPRPLLN